MKKIYTVLAVLLCIAVSSCMQPYFDAQMEMMNYHKQIGRITMQLWLKQTNNAADRADFAEILFSSNYSNAVTESDSIKVVDFSDNLAVKNGKDLLVREYRMYPAWSDTIPLKVWNYTQDTYVFKISCSNWPPDEEAFLLDEVTGQSMYIKLTGINYYSFSVANKLNKLHRFKLVVKSISYS